MSHHRTQTQGDDEYRRSREMSLERAHPPLEIAGYDVEQCIGSGAYGEVWLAVDRNTGRKVAIKYFAHRGGLDWSLMSREVEKLVFLSADRYVVQLIEVGWESNPPYYVMEYLEHGSLDDRLPRNGSLNVAEAVELFREVAIGLTHAHGRGVLHCDLKPANVLLDQDGKPRLADFGQSRLSHEQDPALGTFFYMAPEQADLDAVPDARWDVYALGALLYCMLTGDPPHRTAENLEALEQCSNLAEKLTCYRRMIEFAPVAVDHRRVAGVDRSLSEIIDRCLSVEPRERFPNVQTVLGALDARDVRRARRPLLVLGILGPLLLTLVMGLAAMRGMDQAVYDSEQALLRSSLEGNRFAAEYVARTVENELTRRYRAVENVANDKEFLSALEALLEDPQLSELRAKLNSFDNDNAFDEDPDKVALRTQYQQLIEQHPLSKYFTDRFNDPKQPRVASWFVDDELGLQLTRHPLEGTDVVGKNWGYRTYFTGLKEDMEDRSWRPDTPQQHVQKTQLSTVFRSRATGHWIVSISTPVYSPKSPDLFLGIVALTVEIGDFVELPQAENQLPVLFDWRDRSTKGVILQHELYRRLSQQGEPLPQIRINAEEILVPGFSEAKVNFHDPVANDARGGKYRGLWLADWAPVSLENRDSGLYVLVQEPRMHAIGPTRAMRSRLVQIGQITLGVVIVLVTLLLAFVLRGLSQAAKLRPRVPAETLMSSTVQTVPTVSLQRKED